MWKSLYDSFLQAMTVPWAQYLQLYKSPGKAVRDNFQNKIYPEIGLYLIFITLAFALFYYYYLNLRFGRYYSRKSWFVLLFINSVFVALITYLRAKSMLGGPVIDVSKHLIWIAIINTIYAAILFFIFSCLIKWKSPMGKRTPF